MRASIIPVVLSISILAGVCLSQIFTTFHPNSLESSGPLRLASKSIQIPPITAFDRWMRSHDTHYHAHISERDRQVHPVSPVVSERVKAARSSMVDSPAEASNPLDTIHDEVKKLEMEDRALESAIARADKVVNQQQQRAGFAAAHPSSVSDKKASVVLFTPAQIAADLAKTKDSAKAASSAVINAQQRLKKLVKEEHSLRSEIDALLAKLSRVKIVTGAHVYIADGMGGNSFEAEVSRPIGGKATFKIIKGVSAEVDAVQNKVASDEAAKDINAAPSILPKEKGSDGMGGSNIESSAKEPQNIRPAVVPSKGMTTPIAGDDGMGERVSPAANLPSNVEVSSQAPDSLSSAKPDAGIGENVVPATGYVIPLNEEPKPVIISHGKYLDGIGGTGRHLTPRISNAGATYQGLAPGDGMGGRVHGAVFFGAAPVVPHTGPMSAINHLSDDGMGGGKGRAP
jgi:hypothetical protein